MRKFQSGTLAAAFPFHPHPLADISSGNLAKARSRGEGQGEGRCALFFKLPPFTRPQSGPASPRGRGDAAAPISGFFLWMRDLRLWLVLAANPDIGANFLEIDPPALLLHPAALLGGGWSRIDRRGTYAGANGQDK
jgi:hypothetical protein